MSFAAGWRARALVAFLTFAVAVMGLPLQTSPATAISPNIVISQVYGGGGNAGATLKNDFIELYNRGAAAVDVSGWSVQYASSAGTSWQVTAIAGVIAPGKYFLVQEGQGAGGTTDLPAPHAIGTVAMSATAGKVALVSAGTALTGTGCPFAASVVDFVGYGTATLCREGTASAPTLSNTTAALRAAGGATDTDDNGADFTAGPPNPRNTADLAPYVAATTPGNATTDVANSANVIVTFSENVDLTGGWFSLTCSASGGHTGVTAGGPSSFTIDPDTDFTLGDTCTLTVLAAQVTDQDTNDPPDNMLSDKSVTFSTSLPPTFIHEVQGASHISPKKDQTVVKVPGIVTARTTNGFYMQDPAPDADDATSEGIFVFTSSAPTVSVGDSVEVGGVAREFRPGGASNGNLTTTEIGTPSIKIVSTGNPLPAPIVIGTGGRVPPSEVIEDDASGSVETSGTFDPATDGLDFWESVEGMRIQLNDPVAVGPTNSFGETPVVGDDGANAGVRTARGGVLLRANDGNPERIVADDVLTALPALNVGDRYDAPLVGVVDYNFGNFFLEVTQSVGRIDGGLEREAATAAAQDQLAIATFNFENLDPTDPQSKFDQLATYIVQSLRSPDLIGGEEVQDSSGPADNGVVDANATLSQLIAAIQAAGGPTYEWREIDPVNDQDGGEPGGNIRQVFLFRTDRGLSFVDRPGGTSTSATAVSGAGGTTQLTFSPGRIEPNAADGAWTASRKPLAGEFVYAGQKLFVIVNHFNSKGGDDPLSGRFQPPVRTSEVQRHKQATIVADFVTQLTQADPNANVVVLGDLNDFEFSETATILKGAGLHDLIETLPLDQRYSYEFEGNAQVLDHIMGSTAVFDRLVEFDVVHVNAEFADQASDHDPSVARVLWDQTAPTVTPPAAITVEATSSAGATATYACTALDAVTPQGDLVFDYAIPSGSTFPLGTTSIECGATDAAGNRGTANVTVNVVDTTAPVISGTATPLPNGAGWNNTPVTVHFTCSDFFLASCPADVTLTGDGADQSVTRTATDTSSNSSSATVGGINIDRTAPTLVYTGNAGAYTVDQTVNITCSASDALSALVTNTCSNISGPAYAFLGPNTYSASATDRAGNASAATATFTVGVTADSLCAIVRRVVSDAGIAKSLCQKLKYAAAAELRGDSDTAQLLLNSFVKDVKAQSGKSMTAASASLLLVLVAAF